MAQKITSMVLALRRKVNIKVRQPLQSIMVPATDEQKKHIEAVKQLIMSEVNVKELKFVEGQGILVKKVKCNFRTMGKKFGKLMKSVNAAVLAMSQEQIAELEAKKHLPLTLDTGEQVTVDLEDIEIFSQDIPGWSVANEGTLTVALDLTITEDLRLEGVARELIRSVQTLRKDSDFNITDRINVTLPESDDNRTCLSKFRDYIASQVLADNISLGAELSVSKI
jgi:isoleucyl-tRNA synthetase